MNHKNPSPADPARSLALLWGSQTEAGRSGLTLKAIVAAAIKYEAELRPLDKPGL